MSTPCSTLQVWINAFIPRSVPGYTFTLLGGPHAGKTAIPCPEIALPVNWHCLSRGYLTDQRGFDQSVSASRRMQSMAEFQLMPPAFIAHPGLEHTTSGTTEIDKSSGVVTCFKPADMSKCAFSGFRVEPDPSAPLSGNYIIRLSVKGAASDPCVNLAADIDYNGEITVFCSPRGSFVEVGFNGRVDSFPAFEMYARLNGVTKPLFRLPPPAGHTVVDLLGGASTPVSGHVRFDACQLIASGSESIAPQVSSEATGVAAAVALNTDPAHWFLDATEIAAATGHSEVRRRLNVYTSNNQVQPLIDGAEYMKALYEDLVQTRAGDWFHLTAWRINIEQDLDPPATPNPASPSRIDNLVRTLSGRGVRCRSLIFQAIASGVPGAIRIPMTPTTAHVIENTRARNWWNAVGGRGVIDGRFPLLGSHHQKSAVVVRRGEAVAYCGGIDLCPDRWDTALHDSDPRRTREHFAGWHDCHVRVRGPAVLDIEANFRDRWNASSEVPAEKIIVEPVPPPIRDPWPPVASAPGSHHVQVLRTFACVHDHFRDFAPRGEFTCLAGYLKAISRASDYIYLEDQYLVSEELAHALAGALERIRKLVIVVPAAADTAPEQFNYHQAEFIRILRARYPDKVHVYHLIQPATGEIIYVHAKQMIIDDIYAVTGSPNINRRSMTHDTELAAAVVDAELVDGVCRYARDLRLRLWSEHLGVSTTDPRIGDAVSGVTEWERQAGAGTNRVRHHVTPRPQSNWPPLLWDSGIDPDGRCKSRSLFDALGGETQDGGELAEAEALVGLAEQCARGSRPQGRGSGVLQEWMNSRATGESVMPSVTSLVELFDAMAYAPGSETGRQAQTQFQVVAAPGATLAGDLRRGDVLLRRAEGQSAYVSVIAAPQLRRAPEVAALGGRAERSTGGRYAQVIESECQRRSSEDLYFRRVVDGAGRVPNDQFILRPRGSAQLGERLDPMSLVLGMTMVSSLNRPPEAARPVPISQDEPRDPGNAGQVDSGAVVPLEAEPRGSGLIGLHTRQRVGSVVDVPFRWICQISTRQRKNGVLTELKPAATGVLISPRHVLTAAHVLRSSERGEHGEWIESETEEVIVTPAADSTQRADLRAPFGSVKAKRWQLSPSYDPHRKDNGSFDYALIELSSRIAAVKRPVIGNARLCFWGSEECGSTTTLDVPDASLLTNSTALSAGYPEDLGGGTVPYRVSGTLSQVGIPGHEATMKYDADGYQGQSGSPVWIERNGKIWLAGLFTKVGLFTDSVTGRPTGNEVVRWTHHTFTQVSQWMEAVREDPWLYHDSGELSDQRCSCQLSTEAGPRGAGRKDLIATNPDSAEDDPPLRVMGKKTDDELVVVRSDGTRIHVRRKVRSQVLTRPGRPRTAFCNDDHRVFFRLTWCEGTQGTIDVGANPQDALRNLMNDLAQDISSGASSRQIRQLIENAPLQTFLNVDVNDAKTWKVTGDLTLEINPSGFGSTSIGVSAENRWVKVSGAYRDDSGGKQVLVTVEVPLSKRQVSGRICQPQELAVWWNAECWREVPTTDTIAVPGHVLAHETLYLYFDYASDVLRHQPALTASGAGNVIEHILHSNPVAGTARLNRATLDRLDYLVGQGYWLASVDGYTSPEGKRGRIDTSRVSRATRFFEGNDQLSEARANRALKLIDERYGANVTTLAMRDLAPRMRFPDGRAMPQGVGRSELPRLDTRAGDELEGSALDRTLILGDDKRGINPFLVDHPNELDRMADRDRLFISDSRISLRLRAERLFENLRRVEIHMHKYEPLKGSRVKSYRLERDENCPADVIEAAERVWGTQIPYTRPDPPVCG